jgi:hypothetical protein
VSHQEERKMRGFMTAELLELLKKEAARFYEDHLRAQSYQTRAGLLWQQDGAEYPECHRLQRRTFLHYLACRNVIRIYDHKWDIPLEEKQQICERCEVPWRDYMANV